MQSDDPSLPHLLVLLGRGAVVKSALRILFLAILAIAAAPAGADEGHHQGVDVWKSFAETDGPVVAIGESPREEGPPHVMITVRTANGDHAIVLAPAAVLHDAAFPLRVGDHVRIVSFRAPGDTPVDTYRIVNRSQGGAVRLRTLSRDPLWDRALQYQGPTCGHGKRMRQRNRGVVRTADSR